LHLASGFVYASRSEFRAGEGGNGADNFNCIGGNHPGDGGPGGSGVHVLSVAAPPDVVLLGTLVVAGAGGAGGIDHTSQGGYGCFEDGDPGPDGFMILAPDGSVESLEGAPRRMSAPRFARENEAVMAVCYGRNGDVVQILASDAADFVYDPAFRGVKLIPLQKSVVLASGVIPGNGTLDLQVPLPSVPCDARTIFLQAYFRDTSNQRYVSTQSTVLEVDPRF